MNFPLPVVNEEDRGLLREVRERRKYETRPKKSKSRTSKSDKNSDSSSNCIATLTVIIGTIVVVLTIIFTAMEIIHNRNTQITAYPVDPMHPLSEDSDNSLIKPPPYPGPSMDEIRAELHRYAEHQAAQADLIKSRPLHSEQMSLIPTDFPDDHDPNTMTDLIGTVFPNTEFYRRFRTEGGSGWTEDLSHSKAIYNESLYNQLPICLQITNTANGYGFRVWRDAQVLYHSTLMSCTMAVQWGGIGTCPHQSYINMFEFLFYNNYRFAASHHSLNALRQRGESFPELASYNAYFANLAQVTYDIDGPFINGNMKIVENANEHILLESDKREGMVWPEMSANKYNRDLQVTETMTSDQLVVEEIDMEYATLLGWNGGMNIRPVLDYYGLMVTHLRYKWRKRVVDFMESEFKDKFVIGFHVQIGNKDTPPMFLSMSDTIVSVVQYLLGDTGAVGIRTKFGQNVLVYLSTDCGNGEALNDFVESVRNKVGELKFGEDQGDVEVTLRKQEKKLPEGMGHAMESHYQMDSMEDCIEGLANAQMDAEILGLTDVLVLPTTTGKYRSSFTRLSRALMMMRHKTICKGNSPTEFVCKNFDNQDTASFSTSL